MEAVGTHLASGGMVATAHGTERIAMPQIGRKTAAFELTFEEPTSRIA